ncbi:MAG: co-chaperone GroES [Patescibacteria group bacterium]|nr:co-chaperone GroES [Patescibacteria group bacterium]
MKTNTKLGTPYGDRVLVQPKPVEETTASGIILAARNQEKPTEGTVVAIGPGRRDQNGAYVPLGVKVGDTIRFNGYGYEEIKLAGTEYYLMREDSITFVF